MGKTITARNRLEDTRFAQLAWLWVDHSKTKLVFEDFMPTVSPDERKKAKHMDPAAWAAAVVNLVNG